MDPSVVVNQLKNKQPKDVVQVIKDHCMKTRRVSKVSATSDLSKFLSVAIAGRNGTTAPYHGQFVWPRGAFPRHGSQSQQKEAR